MKPLKDQMLLLQYKSIQKKQILPFDILTEAMINELQVLIYRYLYYQGVHVDQIDDLLQEIWILMIKNISQLQQRQYLKAWAIKIAQNYLYQSWRSQAYQQSKKQIQYMCFDYFSDTKAPNALDLLIEEEKKVSLYRYIDTLSNELQALIYLQISGYTLKEIKEELAYSISDIKNRLFKARKILIQRLENMGI